MQKTTTKTLVQWVVAPRRREDLTPAARRILWSMMVTIQRMHNRGDEVRANKLMRAIVKIADMPSFSRCQHGH